MLAVTVVVLAEPLIGANWKLVPLAVLVAGPAAFGIWSGFNWISAGSRGVAGLTVAVLVVASIAIQTAMDSSGASEFQLLVMAFGPFILFQFVMKSVDRFVDDFIGPLLAGLIGAAVFAGGTPLIAYGHPRLPIWACVGIGAGLGSVEGVVSGALLWRMVPEFLR
jgi:hypothetical protein